MTVYLSTPRPQTSPWGEVYMAAQILPGIWKVNGPSHGGLLLSAQRNQAMPAALHLEGGAYEKHINWGHAVLAFEDEFRKANVFTDGHLQLAHDTVRCWHPKAYETFTGQPVEVNESYVLKRLQAIEAVIGEVCVTAAWGDWAEWVPKGKTGLVGQRIVSVDHLANPSYESGRQWALVDADAYDSTQPVNSFKAIGAQIIPKPDGVT